MILDAVEEHIVVVSDLHLGSPASDAKHNLPPFLDEVASTGTSLCINGDGFDLLQSSGTTMATDGLPFLYRLQKLIERGVNVYYVLGNHDVALEHVLFELPFIVAPFLNLESGGKRIRIEHGHVYEPFYAKHPGLYELGGRVGKMGLFLNRDLYELFAQAQHRVDARRRRSSSEHVYHHYEAAAALFQRGFDSVVFGHTHHPEITALEGGTFANTGDWLRRRSYLRIDHGEMTLGEWAPSD